MAAVGLKSSIFLDGLVGLFENLEFMKDNALYKLPGKIEIREKSAKDFKGVRALHEKKIVEVRFGVFQDMPLSILITTGNLVERISFSDVRKIIVDGVDMAVSLLGPNSPTKFEWNSRCCVEYEKWVSRSTCETCNVNDRRVIFPEDVQEFGQNFIEYVRFWIKEMGYETHIAFYNFGQNLAWDKAVLVYEKLNVTSCTEFVVHVAKDYWQNGKVLLWHRKTIRQQIAPGPMADFFCYFTGGHGNFVFNFTGRNDAGDIQHIKFYSDMFKQIHRGGKSPFRKACVSSGLLGIRRRGREHVDLNGIEGHVNAVSRCRDLVLNRKYNCARVEAIISLKNKDDDDMRYLLEECEKIFNRDFGQAHRHLSVFAFSEFAKQVKICLNPALGTLGSLIKMEKRARETTAVHCVKLETLHLAMACEMLISYFVYGKLDYWRGPGPRFNKELRNSLKLNGGTFRLIEETFRGLEFTDAITLSNGELVYSGPMLIEKFVTVEITDEDNQTRLCNCLEILATNESNPSRLEEVYEALSEILWEEILVFAQKFGCRTAFGMTDDRSICNFLKSKPHRAISSYQFVAWMFRNANLEQQVIQKVVQAIRHTVGTVDILRQELASKVEMELWRGGKALLYPAEDKSITLLVLPSSGAGACMFSTATNDIKESIATQYREAWKMIYGNNYDLQISEIIKILRSSEGRVQIDQSDLVEVIFRQMMLKFIKK